MKIAYYCQHVLGVGHLHRSHQICLSLAKTNEVTLILGGEPIEIPQSGIRQFQLPGLMMDTTFNNLTPCDPHTTLEETKAKRASSLLSFFKNQQQDIFIIELYPFGRKGFRFELDPVLDYLTYERQSRCLIVCSLRDILVERHDQDKFESRVVSTLNKHFHGLLIHGDKNLIPLEKTFSKLSEIKIPYEYTGYVVPHISSQTRENVRSEKGLDSKDKLVVASIGGGNVGEELLLAAMQAIHHVQCSPLFLEIFLGPYSPPSLYDKLTKITAENVRIRPFSTQFSHILAAADLSISMAGYNTSMNVLAAGTPALLYPFMHNQEQRMRLEQLSERAPLKMLSVSELEPRKLAHIIDKQLQLPRFSSPVNLEGAKNSHDILQHWHAHHLSKL